MACLSSALSGCAAVGGLSDRKVSRSVARRPVSIVRCQTSDAGSVSVGRRQIFTTTLAIAGLCLAGVPADARAACTMTSAPGGLQFCDEVEGTGAEPARGSLIRAHYTGRLASNGQKFDSSLDRGRPLSFKVGVGEVIKGWDLGIVGGEGVPPMKEGGKRKLIIPADLAYGERGAGRGLIPPGATLEFDVELLAPRR